MLEQAEEIDHYYAGRTLFFNSNMVKAAYKKRKFRYDSNFNILAWLHISLFSEVSS